MREYCAIFNHIKNNSSRKVKEELLKRYEDVDGLKDIFRFVYNPIITTGLAKKKLEKEITSVDVVRELKDIHEAIQFVTDNNTGTDYIVKSIQVFLETKLITDEEREFAKAILTKDLPIGISVTTLNKVYGDNFIQKHKVMKGQKYDPNKYLLKGEEFYISIKIDGLRSTTFNYEDRAEFKTTGGLLYEGLVELEDLMNLLPKGFVYEGELLARNTDNLNSNELFRLTSSRVKTDGIKKDVRFLLFDMIPIEDYEKKKGTTPYKLRRAILESTIKQYLPGQDLIDLTPVLYVGNDKSQIDYYFNEVVSQGFEGLMVHLADGIFELKKSKNVLKVKPQHTIDLRVLDIEEDIRGGKCGSIIVDYHGHRVGVAGLKNQQKIDFWNDPSSIIGKIVEISYMEETKNEKGGISLRHSSLERVRVDKNEVSYA